MKNEKGLFAQISQGINDMCYIWWLEMKNTFKDEGMLIFFILVPLGIPCSTHGFIITRWFGMFRLPLST